MDYCDLLERMKRNDTEAFLEMTDRYGWSVYAAIREKYRDPSVADKVYNETMNAFYHILADSEASDPVEALINGLADRISPENLPDMLVSHEEDSFPEIRLTQAERATRKAAPAEKHRKSFWYYLCVSLLLLVIVFMVWIWIGFLMQMEYIPFVDLGYSWLDVYVLQIMNSCVYGQRLF